MQGVKALRSDAPAAPNQAGRGVRPFSPSVPSWHRWGRAKPCESESRPWTGRACENRQNADSENRFTSSDAFMPQIGCGSQRVGGTLFHWGANGVRLVRQEGEGMGTLEDANNQEVTTQVNWPALWP